MILHVFDQNFNRQGMIENYISVAWEEDYYGRGAFLLVCVDSAENIALLNMGWYLFAKGKQTAMVIRYIRYDSGDSQITVHGYTTNDLLSQRIVYPTKSIYNVESGMYAMVTDNLRGLPRVVNASPAGYTDIFGTQFTGDNLLDAQVALGRQAQLGFRMVFDHANKRHVFTVYKGTDRTISSPDSYGFFSQEFGNLANMIIADDISLLRNVAYVAGAGEGDDRTWVTVGTAAGNDRFELYVDARDLQQKEGQAESQYVQLLAARGLQKLNENIRAKTFVAEVDPIGFGRDFFLGDVVSSKSSKYKVQINTRIIHYAEVREQNKTKLSLTLGSPEIMILSGVETWRI